MENIDGAREAGDSVVHPALSPAPRAQPLLRGIVILGLAPQALRCRSLRELCNAGGPHLTNI